MAKRKWFRVAREGVTIDGREIKKDYLLSMAKNYDTEIYQARLNKEHLRGFSNEEFGAFGDVYGLKTETDKTGKVVLLALIEPLPQLVQLNKKGQKVFTSVEIGQVAEFEGHYLLGLAVTDSPASTGTEMLKFSLGAKGDDAEKVKSLYNADSLYSEYLECEMDLTESDSGETLLSKVKILLSANAKKTSVKEQDFAQAITELAQSQADLIETVASLSASIESADIEAMNSMAAEFSSLQSDYKALESKLSKEPSDPARPESGTGNFALTDC